MAPRQTDPATPVTARPREVIGNRNPTTAMSAIQITVFLGFSACFASFIWAMTGGHFRAVERPSPGLRVIQIAGFVFTSIHAYVLLGPGNVAALRGVIALAAYLLAFTLFWACIRANRRKPLTLAFSSDTPDHVMTDGPYRRIRHPFYTSYTLAWIAGVLATGQLWLMLSVIFMLIVYVSAAMSEERKFLRSALAERYVEYRKRTGMFLPRILSG